jgi:CRP-like cAMP-binding protein
MSRRFVSEHIARVPMFSACTKRELATISRLTSEVDVPAGRVLAEEGRPGSEFDIVLEGRAVARRNGRKVATFGPGDYFGEIALLDPGERTATVTAETDMLLGVVTPSALSQMLDEVPALAHKVMRGLARQIRELTRATSV